MITESKGITRLAKVVLVDLANIADNNFFARAIGESYNLGNWYNILGTGFIITKIVTEKTNRKTMLQIWKLNQDEKFKHLIELYAQGARGVIISFDPLEQNFGEKLFQLIEDYITLFYYPIAIGLIGSRSINECSNVKRIEIKEILNDIKLLISQKWNSRLVVQPYLNSETTIIKFFENFVNAIDEVIEEITYIETLELNIQVIASLIKHIIEYFPEYSGRVFLSEKKEIIVKGHLHDYYISFDARSYIILRGRKKHLCLVEKKGMRKIYRKNLELFITQDSIYEKFGYLPKEYYSLMLLITAKIIYLLNDSYFEKTDLTFSQQVRNSY